MDRVVANFPVSPQVWADERGRQAFLGTAGERLTSEARERGLELVGALRAWLLTPPGHPDGAGLEKAPAPSGYVPDLMIGWDGGLLVQVEADVRPAREALIIRSLAGKPAPVDAHRGCLLCGAFDMVVLGDEPTKHARRCPWRMAREWAAEHPAEPVSLVDVPATLDY